MGSSWFSAEDGKKGALAPGQLADLAILSADYLSIPDEEIMQLESLLTIVGGEVVFASNEYCELAAPPLHVSPDWPPVKEYGGYPRPSAETVAMSASRSASAAGEKRRHLSRLG